MKYIKQFSILLTICLVGELLVLFLPFGFPGNIMAMILLVLLLSFKVIKSAQIEETSQLLLECIGLFIVPISVSMISHLELIRTIWWQLLVISLATLFLTFASTAFTIRLLMGLMNAKKKEGTNHDGITL